MRLPATRYRCSANHRKSLSGNGIRAIRLGPVVSFLPTALFVLTTVGCSGLQDKKTDDPLAAGPTTSDRPTTEAATASENVASQPSFELLGAVQIVSPTDVDEPTGSPIGGLSALTYDASRDRFYVLSDDRAQFGPARLYPLTLQPAAPLTADDVALGEPIALLDPSGSDFAPGTVDPEGIALGDGIFVSSEGVPELGISPWIRQFDLDGTHQRELTIPERYRPSADGERGVRENRAFESLTLSPDGRRLFTATEAALLQDGPDASLDSSSPVRILELDTVAGLPRAEYLYQVDPVHAAPDPPDALAVNGLVELIALSNRRLLALERSFAVGAGYSIRLYDVDLGTAENVLERSDLSEVQASVKKNLLLKLEALDLVLDNFEGMAFGPALADGRSNLWLIADDNFAPERQKSWVVSLAVSGL